MRSGTFGAHGRAPIRHAHWPLLAVVLLGTVAPGYGEERPWTVADSIGVTYFVADPQSRFPRGTYAQAIKPDGYVMVSPGGRYFFFVTYRGDLRNDQNLYELYIYRSRDVLDAIRGATRTTLEALRRVELASAHADEFLATAIYAPTWEKEGAITFVGVDRAGIHRVYRLQVESGVLTPLTPEDRDVLTMPHTPFALRKTSTVFASRHYEEWRPLDTYPMATIRGHELAQILDDRVASEVLYASYRGGAARVVAKPFGGRYRLTQLSPNEKWIVVIYPPADEPIPAAWFDYEVKPQYGYRFVLIDLESGEHRQFFDAPAGTATAAGRGREKAFDAFWAADSSRVILYNTALPLTEHAEERRRMSYIVDYEVRTGEWSILQRMINSRGDRVRSVEWLQEGTQLLVRHETREGAAGPGIAYSFNGRGWTARTMDSSVNASAQVGTLPAGLTVSLRENANELPVMIASLGKREVSLTAPDATLAAVRRALVEQIEIPGPRGKPESALLMVPRDRPAAKPLPLVMQLSRAPDRAFRPDGVTAGVYAAQALAAQGFVVLQIDASGDPSLWHRPQEGPEAVERIDVAVETLASRGLVDPTRVGLVGFSRAGYMAYYTLANPGRTRIAAAVVFDSISGGYGDYVASAAIGDPLDIYEKQYGHGTFWENKDAWLRFAPAFNVDRVVAPALFGTTGNDCKWAPLETVGAFRYVRRPLEYICFPQASHVLQRPRQRQAAMQITVDWMNFWLQDRERIVEKTHDRFERWRTLRAEWQQRIVRPQ